MVHDLTTDNILQATKTKLHPTTSQTYSWKWTVVSLSKLQRSNFRLHATNYKDQCTHFSEIKLQPVNSLLEVIVAGDCGLAHEARELPARTRDLVAAVDLREIKDQRLKIKG